MTEDDRVASYTLLQTVFSDALLNSLSDYHMFLQKLTHLCLSDSQEYVSLCGPGYDSLPPLYKLFDFGCGQITAKPNLSAQSALVANQYCAVLEDPAVQYNKEYRNLFYATPAKDYNSKCNASLVLLHVSSRTHSLLLQEKSISSISQSIVVRSDLHEAPRFYISSDKYEACFQSHNTQLLLYQLPGIKLDIHHVCGGKSCVDSNKVLYGDYVKVDDTGLWHDSGKLNIGAIKRRPVFRCLEWPLCALPWTARPKKWPNNALVHDVINSPVFLKPSPQCDVTCIKTHSDQEGVTAALGDLLWSYDFSIAECALLSHVSADAKRVFFLLQSLIDDSPELYTALKHVLLWCVEEYGPNLETEPSSLNSKLTIVICKLESFMSNNGVPHYFIPEYFILDPDTIRSSSICKVFGAEKGFLDHMLLEVTGMVTLAYVKDLAFCSNIMLKNMQTTLFSAVEHNSKLLCMQLYQKLHGFDTAWKSIESHHQVISSLVVKGDLQCPEIHKTVTGFVQASLGGMYFVQGVQAYNRQERRTLFSKADEYFAAVENSEMVSNKLKRALMLLKREQYQLVLNEVEELFSRLYVEVLANEMEENMPKYETDLPFITGLEKAAVHAMLNMDYLVMKVEKPGLPKEIVTNLSLAEFQLLGYTPYPVAVLDTTILCGVIVSYCYSCLKMFSNAKKALEKVEGMSLKDEIDQNERRGCFYLNIIAHAYKKANDVDQARYLLQRSVAILNSARNPGRWALLSMNNRKFNDFLWGGIGVAVATTAAVVTLIFINKKS